MGPTGGAGAAGTPLVVEEGRCCLSMAPVEEELDKTPLALMRKEDK